MIDVVGESELMPFEASPLPAARRVLVLAPHPDDEVFGCGGTLFLLAETGAAITVVVATDGAQGGAAGSGESDTLIREREAEACAAAVTLGYAAPVFWRLADRGLRYGEALVERLIEAIRKTQAELVFAPALTELHPDHQALALAAAEALRRLGGGLQIAFYEVSAPQLPNMIIDITAAEAAKAAAMRCFRSQLAQQPYDEHITALNRYRTYTLASGAHAAEAFFATTAAELANGILPLFESALARRRKLGAALGGSDAPLVSVIVRSMDRPTLPEALASIAAQTYPNIEVLVVNAKGGRHSPLTDFGARLLLRLIETGSALGRSRAANAGLDAARGVYVAFLDDDDTLDPDHLSALVAKLREEGEGAVAYAGVRCVERDDPQRKVSRVFGEPFEGNAKLLAGNFIPVQGPLFPRALLRNGARFDEALEAYEDWDFWLQLAAVARFVYVDRVSATYFSGGTSGVSPLAFDPGAVRRAAGAVFNKWKERISADELKALADLYLRCRAELLGAQGEIGRLASLAQGAADTRLTSSEARLRDAEASEEALRRALVARERDVALLTASVEELRTSNSWRITAPLRWCGRQRARIGRLWRAWLGEHA